MNAETETSHQFHGIAADLGIKCIYCDNTKHRSEVSLEHIWPDKAGGNLLPAAIFQTEKVCRRCNSTSGLYIDGAFLRSWFGRAERASGWEQYVDLDIEGGAVVPLTYLGYARDANCKPEEVCELWLGPNGDHIIHFHEQDSQNWIGSAGGDPIKRKKADPGRAYIALCSDHPQWVILALRSFACHFGRADCFVVNAELPKSWGQLKGLDNLQMLDRSQMKEPSDLTVVDKLIDAGKNGSQIGILAVCNMYGDQRFLAKLALGLGFTTLGDKYLETDHAKTLRTALWQRDPTAGVGKQVFGRSYFCPEGDTFPAKFLGWPGAWVLWPTVIDDALSMIVVTPSGKWLQIQVSTDPGLWAGSRLAQGMEGSVVYVLVPQLGLKVDPVPYPEYLAHKLGNKSNAYLANIEARRKSLETLPPKRKAP